MSGFAVAIPARWGSSRLPGKPLAELGGEPLVRHVHRAALASGAREVVIATDDERIASACRAFDAEVVLTRADHPTGTDRLAEVAERRGWAEGDVVVNLQGDEPFMPPALVRQVAEALAARPGHEIATLAVPLGGSAELRDPAVVKVVCDVAGDALYFSRAPIPWDRERAGDGGTADDPRLGRGEPYRRHLGLYAYRAGFLRRFPGLEPGPLEPLEQLEQLRALWHGARIHVGDAAERPGPGIDTAEDLARAAAYLASRG